MAATAGTIGTAAIVATLAGFGAIGHHLSHVRWGFIPVIIAPHLLAYMAYAAAYYGLVNLGRGPHVTWAQTVRIVAVGFGAFGLGGGFALDRRALHGLGTSRAGAAVSSIGLGFLELAILTPFAWVCALGLLGAPHVQEGETIPWVIIFPIIFTLSIAGALRGSDALHFERVPGVRRWAGELLAGLSLAMDTVRHPRRGSIAFGGIAVYWAADILSLWASLQLFSVTLSASRVILAYASGYLFSRRALPLAGVGASEVLMSVALVWVGVPLAAALLAVLVYRLTDLALTLGPALIAGPAVERMILGSPTSRGGSVQVLPLIPSTDASGGVPSG